MAADTEDEILWIRQIEDELNEPLTGPVKESTVDYYHKKKDKVGSYSSVNIYSPSNKLILT